MNENVPNNNRQLFIASFFTLIAAGAGFAIRGGILEDWGAVFGFTKLELGTITGGGLFGFGIIIILASLIIDRLGYKPILVVAFVLHVLSAIVTLAATPVFNASGKNGAYWCLYIGMFLFSVANGLCEAVINPLVATLYPKQKTHYLNILHAGWPGGLIVGGLFAACFVGPKAFVTHMRWEIPMAFFLLPTLIYGIIILKEKFPVSEARAAGVAYTDMLKEFAAPLFLFLLLLHACVGYVELGTDSWIASITESILTRQGLMLFVYASSIMFVLRFFAGPIVERINPLGLLFLSACLGVAGLLLISRGETAGAIWIAVSVYGVGKSFLWPTMLGVVGERFPKGGAITMGTIGGVGMLSAGLLGGPGIGYKQDYYASKHLKAEAPATYERYQADNTSSFLFLPEITGLDGSKVSVIKEDVPGTELEKTAEQFAKDGTVNEDVNKLVAWWANAKKFAGEDKQPVKEAVIYGGRMALKWTALIPACMALGYLILVLYFRAKGGYQAEVLHGGEPEGEHYTGGVEGPVE